MTMLKLRTIDLDYCSRTFQQGLGGCLHDPSLSRARWTKEERISDRPADRRQSRQVSLVSPHDLVNRFLLSNDEVAELVLQMFRLPSVLAGSSSSILAISNSLAL